MLKNAFILLLMFLPMLSFAQADSVGVQKPKCGFGEMRIKVGIYEHQTAHFKKDSLLEDDGSFYIIPVVFHIIHNGGAENIPDSLIFSQVDVLNEDFGRYGNGSNSNPVSGDSKIRFCLATKDPDGNPTNGIVRVKSAYTRLDSDNEMLTKNLSRWDQRRYLNIWVVRDIDRDPSQQGYSYLPSEILANPYRERDGIVIIYRRIGRNSRIALSNHYLGHALTHETGHFLNLLHTWGDDRPGKGDCYDDDKVGDTPLCSLSYESQYDFTTQSCERPVQCDYPRMIENYMDYSEDRCLNLFTKGQIARMRDAIRLYRGGLVNYANAVTTGCKQPYFSFNPVAEDELQILANPSTGLISIYPKFTSFQNAQLIVYDALGRIVATHHYTNLQNNRQDLYIPSLKNALYFFVLQTPKKKFTQKIIVLPNRN